MKGLLLLLGESFRLGNQGTRSRGEDASYPEQIRACKTHMKFIEALKTQGCDMDIRISSYTTKFDNDLINIYKDNLVNCIFYNHCIGIHNLFHNSMKTINVDTYDFIVYIRIDLCLKDGFINIFNPSWETIRFPSICFLPYSIVDGHPRVNNMLLFIPKKYFKYIGNMDFLPIGDDGHRLWAQLIKTTDLTYNDLDTMIHTFHDSDSAKDYNPLYYIVNRNQQTIFHSEGNVFDKYNLTMSGASFITPKW
jgi:hypothetical protein